MICESFMHNGLIILLSLYPIKYLNELFVQNGFFLYFIDINAVYLGYFFVFVKAICFNLFVSKISVLSAHSYTWWNKELKYFYNDFGCTKIDRIFYCRSEWVIFQHNGLIMFWNAFFKSAICEQTDKTWDTFDWQKEFKSNEKQVI